jgi:hypothetical protein
MKSNADPDAARDLRSPMQKAAFNSQYASGHEYLRYLSRSSFRVQLAWKERHVGNRSAI